MFKRLYLQIYFTIITTLVLVVVATATLFALFGPTDFDERIFDITTKLTIRALPSANASNEQQAQAVRQLGSDLGIRISLFDSNRNMISAHGRPSPPPPQRMRRNGWQRHGRGPGWIIKLPDQRWLAVNLGGHSKRRPFIGLLILFATIAAVVGLASYPFVRRLTGRIERLQQGVQRIGDGDLSTRVEVEGKDEVAGLANSFNETAEKVENLVDAHKTLLANASHELRTPLSRIRLGIEMLKKTADKKRHEALQRDIAELDTLIDEILLMSRLDSGSLTHNNETVDMLALVAEECAQYSDCTLEGSAPEIIGNPRLLRRVIRNLLENASKHGKPPVSVHLSREMNELVLRVTDCGPGIAPHERENVFQRFYRGAGRQNVEGYGLGLPLVRQIAQAHGGSVVIEDEPEFTICVRLPLPQAKADQ